MKESTAFCHLGCAGINDADAQAALLCTDLDCEEVCSGTPRQQGSGCLLVKDYVDYRAGVHVLSATSGECIQSVLC